MMLPSFCLDVLIVALGAVGTALHFAEFGWSMFRYYTLCSNVFLLLACAAQAWFEGRILLKKALFVPSWARVLKYCAVCTVMVTFFVVIFILVPLSGGPRWLAYALTHGAMLYHHTLCPLLGLASFVFADRVSLPDRRVTLLALAPTMLYALIATTLNITRTLDGPYPFLRVYEQPVWLSAVWYVVILGMAWALALAVQKLSLRFAAPREDAPADPGAEAWTAEGYVKNQDALSGYTYRAIPARHNACGPAAAYNLRRHEGHAVRFEEVLAEMDGMHLLRMPGPTFLYVMRRYLRRYLPGWREARGRGDVLAAMERGRMGIVRYQEQRVPHFVAYYRVSGGALRFFNVSDDAEDRRMTAAEFAAGHLLGGGVRLFYWE